MGKWGDYAWLRESGAEPAHPDDRELFHRVFPNGGAVVEWIDGEHGYMVARFKDTRLRLNPSGFKELPDPPVTYGQIVRVLSKGSPVEGTVCDLIWHRKKQAYYFHVCVEAKPLKKQYWKEDILEVPQ